ncbi:MAG: glycosyl hydrolase 53 family protein [Candidatus Microbacterium phytovorans]|uniref:Arabinogalactan endo-beta-1,4-galactanase n=1 Tax=Candidatus Microbacterium phytovorans TaxID=3121374 RepID=A0AAJ5W0A8_9MICO|nr:glycosyl hydrolase 53 family protein [Microbacterium sp.]WEK13392.1 MAG: glycosyl hydrolase 53 family protein [Microbacterium sp.]
MRQHLVRLAAVAAAATLTLGVTATPALAADEGPVDADIFVQKVDGLDPDFTMGVDISSYLSLIDSGVVFRDSAGQPANFFEVLADHGVTDVRLRVWNDPYNSTTGAGYGGGTVDAERAAEMGKLATDAGLGVLVDFHYSDFWADPGKQKAPKAWAGYTIAQKAAATKAYTIESLELMKTEGVDVTMVQVGNETTNGVAGETSWANIAQIFQAGSEGVRQVFPDALVAVHFTNPNRANYTTFAGYLQTYGVDYDVFASSYYAFWHGTLANLKSELNKIVNQYGKKVIVAETSWAYTLDDADGHPNVIRTAAAATQYPVSVQGQSRALRDVIATVSEVDQGAGLGVYYWEPAWLPVGPPSALEANKVLWERDGSGWASSAASEYDPADAGVYFGGSAWDNQALFAADGTPLSSLSTFEWVYTGTTAPLEVVSYEPVSLTFANASAVALPATVTVVYNDGSTGTAAVEWSDAVSWITSPGSYTVSGVTAAGLPVSASVTVTASTTNHVANPGFETATAPWTVTGTGGAITATTDASSGTRAFKFYSGGTYSTAVSQTVTGLEPGTYQLSAVAHGGAFTSGSATLRAVTSEGSFETPLSITAWGEHNSSSVVVQVGENGEAVVSASLVDAAGGTWGTFDDFSLVAFDPSTVDTTDLAALVAEADGLDRSLYTDATLATLDAALEKARIVLAASAPTEEQRDIAAGLVGDALEGLEEIVVPALEVVAAPVISGTARVGQTLTASAGEFTPAVDHVDYQWLRDGVAIDGATASTYTVVAADRGASLTVAVTASRAGFTSATAISTAVAVPRALTVGTPKISGSAVVGGKLTASVSVSPTATKAYQWYADGKAVSGAKSATYTVKRADAGKKLTVRITLTRSGYETVAKTSASVTVAKLFAKVSTPKISGTAKVGKKLTASISVSPAAAKTYQWYVNGKAVSGAKSASYTVRKADAGKKVTVKVTVSKSGYQSVSKVSAPKKIAK